MRIFAFAYTTSENGRKHEHFGSSHMSASIQNNFMKQFTFTFAFTFTHTGRHAGRQTWESINICRPKSNANARIFRILFRAFIIDCIEWGCRTCIVICELKTDFLSIRGGPDTVSTKNVVWHTEYTLFTNVQIIEPRTNKRPNERST